MRHRHLHDGTHLTESQRGVIQAGIENGSAKSDIARIIGKDATTVAKEIRRHRRLKPRNAFGRPVLCAKADRCPKKPCVKKCPGFAEPGCHRRDVSPGACNGCGKTGRCLYDKYFYYASEADGEYRRELAGSRGGLNLTQGERAKIGGIISPLLQNGQPVHQVVSAHPETGVSQRSPYAYIECGVFKEFGVDKFSLKERVGRRLPKKYKKRRGPANFNGRKYADFLNFRGGNPGAPATEMDTVYNSPSGPYLQTSIFERTGFMIGFLHDARTNETMSGSLDLLQAKLGAAAFSRLFPLLLADRGSEFEKREMFERDGSGNARLRIFYCDPMQPSQKPHVENNHNYARDIIPNGFPLGCLTQTDIGLTFSHINGVPRLSPCDKTPYEMFCFPHGAETAGLLNITEVPRDGVVLKPRLIFRKAPQARRFTKMRD
jgi:IS30 family transposase